MKNGPGRSRSIQPIQCGAKRKESQDKKKKKENKEEQKKKRKEKKIRKNHDNRTE